MKVVFARVPSNVGLLGAIRISINSIEIARLNSFGGPVGLKLAESNVQVELKITGYPPELLRLEGSDSTTWLVEVMMDPTLTLGSDSRARAGKQPAMFMTVDEVDNTEEAETKAVKSNRGGAASMRRKLQLIAVLTVVAGCIAILFRNWFLAIGSILMAATAVPAFFRRPNPEVVTWVDTTKLAP